MKEPDPFWRHIDFDFEPKTIKIKTEAGYIIEVPIFVSVTMNPVTEYEDKLPDFGITVSDGKPIKVIPDNPIPLKEMEKILANRTLSPKEYGHAELGFVYGTNQDPNNHRWWLYFINEKSMLQSVFCDDIFVNCPAYTVSWMDESKQFFHGRMAFDSKDIDIVKQIDAHRIRIDGIKKFKAPKKTFNFDESVVSLRIRYNNIKNSWFVEHLDKYEETIKTAEHTNLKINVPMKGVTDKSTSKPRTSFKILVSDISEIKDDGLILQIS